MNEGIDNLVRRATPLVFGIFGQREDLNGERIVRVGGSGIFIAPFQCLTARHVTRDLFRTDPMRADDLNRREAGYFELPHSSALFQAHAAFGRNPRLALWHVRRAWDPVFTDICFMEAFADGDEAAGMERCMGGFFDWSLLPPPVGARVIMLGYPLTEIKTKGNLLNINLKYVSQEGHVSDVHELKRDNGMLNFPCFRIDSPVNHGFSGGPVFWEDRICGIVSGGGFDDCTYAASLWPLCLLEYKYPDLGVLGESRVFGDLFEAGVLCSKDWPEIKKHIHKEYDGNGRPYVHYQN